MFRVPAPRGGLLVLALIVSSCAPATGGGDAASAASSKARAPAPVVPPGHAVATFAGGCFWCMEPPFEKLAGVRSVTSGYSGGREKDPTYDQVSSGRTGHAEAVQIVYDPAVIGYDDLLGVFWRNIDPTQSGGQFCDRGRQYRSAIFYHDATQRRLAEASRAALLQPRRFRRPIVTEVVPFAAFYPAEQYHQDFHLKDPERYHAYREGCGRDRRLEQLWGKASAGGR